MQLIRIKEDAFKELIPEVLNETLTTTKEGEPPRIIDI